MADLVGSNAFLDTFDSIKEVLDALTEQGQNSNLRPNRFTAFVTYCYSWYGLACMAIAIVLNRTLVVASTNNSRVQQMLVNRRRHSIVGGNKAELLKHASQLAFRLVTIGVLVYNAYNVLMTLNTMAYLTGREANWVFRLMRWTGWFEYDVETSSKYYKTPKTQVMIGPCTDMYWPVFLGFCLSSFVETFMSSIEGVKPYTEAGLTIFEHSFAFQEASSTGNLFLGDYRVTRRPTEELLVICLFSTLNHLNIHIGALVNKNKYRLIPSTIIGLGFLWYFTNILMQGKWSQFPVIIVGTIFPQLLIIAVIALSMVIFVLAMFATGFNLKDLNYGSFFLEQDPEFQERTFFKLSDDFYTTLLNLGMLSITSAGKSSYITELSIATVDDETWVERSIWQKFGYNLRGLLSSKPHKHQLVNLIKTQSSSRGYSNLIAEPSMKLVTGGHKTQSAERTTVMKRRFRAIQTITKNFLSLLVSIFVDKFVLQLFSRSTDPQETKYDIMGEEDYDQLQERRNRLPAFLRKFVKPKVKQSPETATATLVELDAFTDEDLSQQYVQLLKGSDLSERDGSTDFQDYESEWEESDIESVVDDVEFISPQSFQELITDDNNLQILKSHLAHSSGVMTRSKFRQTSQSSNAYKDETTKLIEVLLSKRQGHLEKVLNGDVQDELNDDLTSKLDCVICQVNTREIITWPCKCFSICEGCRLTLASKGIEGCVCCRKNVDGVSRVFVP